jgi:hypothetical protein
VVRAYACRWRIGAGADVAQVIVGLGAIIEADIVGAGTVPGSAGDALRQTAIAIWVELPPRGRF